ncbi:MAG: hypothetical protein CO021_00635 [Deltaproteobacteria bacterium CG_4_9_14_0_2_um_filter_42_21]|nr:MAG: hypothetical protein CO021_00635 [Deltaproteobacteria bacterium CG_4_9_14_0_2_um_filter_42_21]
MWHDKFLPWLKEAAARARPLAGNPRVRAFASLGAAKLAEYAGDHMEPGTARGLVYLASAALAFESGFSSVGAGTASFVVAFTTAETGIGALGGVAIGTFFFSVAAYDAQHVVTYYRKAEADFGR